MNSDIAREVNETIKKKSILTKHMRCLKKDLESEVLQPKECLEKGLEELMEIIRVKLKDAANDKIFKARYNGFDNMLSLIEYMFPDFNISPYQRIYSKISEKVFGFIKPEPDY